MSAAEITTLENGNVRVVQTINAWDNGGFVIDEIYTCKGSYVYKVHANGVLSQVCKGLRPTGPTLHAGPDLANIIRKTLSE